MFAKGFVSGVGRTAMIAGVAATVLTAVPPSLAIAAPAEGEGFYGGNRDERRH